MSLSHHLLTFDSAALGESDQVGAHLIAGGTALTATGTSLDVNITNASIAISTTDLDIRDLVYTQDSVLAHINELVADDAADSFGSLKVGSRAMATLSAVSATNDRADLISDMYRRIYVNSSPNIAANLLKPTVSDIASQADATPLAGRKKVLVQNLSDKSIYLGVDNTVTVLTGIEIPKKGDFDTEWGENIEMWLISAAGITSNVRILEMA